MYENNLLKKKQHSIRTFASSLARPLKSKRNQTQGTAQKEYIDNICIQRNTFKYTPDMVQQVHSSTMTTDERRNKQKMYVPQKRSYTRRI